MEVGCGACLVKIGPPQVAVGNLGSLEEWQTAGEGHDRRKFAKWCI
jgi:hypothetical protein